MSTEKLFEGQPDVFGGLSNELELSDLCPKQFQNKNPWSTYATILFYRNGNIANWKWKSNDLIIRGHQLACFVGLLHSFLLTQSNKMAVAGWMLSEMLSEVPEHVPSEETAKS